MSTRREQLRYLGIAIAASGGTFLLAREHLPQAEQQDSLTVRDGFMAVSDEIYARHWQQTKQDVAALREKYRQPALGELDTLDCFRRLSLCVDPTDHKLLHTNQLIHTLQTMEGIELDGIKDPDLLFAAAVHDLGKLLLLADEAPENVVCANRPIGNYKPGIGLDNVVYQWNHDEFVYQRLREFVPDHIAWLIRYHSIDFKQDYELMDARDRRYTEQYLSVFRKYDNGTKSNRHVPRKDIEDYAPVIFEYLPKRLVI